MLIKISIWKATKLKNALLDYLDKEKNSSTRDLSTNYQNRIRDYLYDMVGNIHLAEQLSVTSVTLNVQYENIQGQVRDVWIKALED